MKKVKINDEELVMAVLAKGMKVAGRLWLEEKADGSLQVCFQRYDRKPYKRPYARLLRVLEHGWVKESAERIKVYESVPKELGAARLCMVFDRGNEEVKEVVIERGMKN